VIFWKDFVLDDGGLGPVLSPDLFSDLVKDRRDLRVTRSRVKEDASAQALIQETRRDAEPFRNANTGCVRETTWTQVHDQGMESQLETNAPSHTEVGSEPAGKRLRGAG
jgi:hypothetical protein